MTIDPATAALVAGAVGAFVREVVQFGRGVLRRRRSGEEGGDDNGHAPSPNPSVLTPALAKHIDERAEHKARGAVSAVTMETSLLRRGLAKFESEASGRFDAVEKKVDVVTTDVAELRGYLRGKLGE